MALRLLTSKKKQYVESTTGENLETVPSVKLMSTAASGEWGSKKRRPESLCSSECSTKTVSEQAKELRCMQESALSSPPARALWSVARRCKQRTLVPAFL